MGRKGLGSVSKETVLADSSCVQAASYKLKNYVGRYWLSL